MSSDTDLFGDLVQGTLSDEGWARLESKLASDPAARREYREYLNLHVGLASYGAVPAAAPARPRRIAPVWLAAAAGFLLAALAFLRAPEEAAVLVRTSGAAWTGGRAPLQPGARLGPEEISLDGGYAEFRFARGVRLLAEGPVRLRLVDPLKVRLERGHVVVHVPPAGRGFVLETPPARVVDLGTEFGVGVREDGRTDVQVFQGKVTAEKMGSGVVQPLDEGRALRIDGVAGSSPVGIPFQAERFVRMLPTDDDGGQPAGPVYNMPRHEAVQVLLAPRGIVIDGDLSDWDRAGSFRAACRPPYHEGHTLEAALRYDERFLYVAARVGDPAPMRSTVDRNADGRFAWRGGSVILRLATDPALGWPMASFGPAIADSQHPDYGRRPVDVNERIAHLTFWYHQPSASPRLHLAYGMDFHGEQVDPQGWTGSFRVRPDGLGYVLEYAVPWSLLNAAARPPRAGDVLPCTWAAHWSDREGKLSRGHLVEVANTDEVPYRFLRGPCWGKAVFRDSD